MNAVKTNGHYIISVLAVGGIALAAFNFNSKSLFENLDNFVLFAEEEIKLEKGIQISSGDLGSNQEVEIEKDAIINGNLLADEIMLDKNVIVNGNLSFNQLKTQKETQILGTQTKPVSLPIANLPEIPDFLTGTQDLKFEGQNNTLSAGSYRNITLEKDSRLILTGGIYNLNKLELKENSTLIFNSPTIFNIRFKLKGEKRVSILPGQKLKPDDLVINYSGIKPKQPKPDEEDDDNDEEIESFLDDQERKELKERKTGRPIVFGQSSFINFKLLAPKAKVHVEKESTLRGQIFAKKIKVEKESVVSREVATFKEFDPAKIIIDSEKSIYPANEVIVNFTSDATVVDAQAIAELVHGTITGYISFANAYQIQVPAATEAELEAVINQIKSLNSPKIEGAFPNFIKSIEGL